MIKNDSQAPSCTCPSGDGSLRHPCPAHPAVEQAGANVGHGHVLPRADGVKMRCGGPGLCSECTADASRARAALAQPSAALPPFAEKVLAKLRRFYDCASDFESGGVDIGRHWLDLLTQLGLLNRVQRSPAFWEISQQGEDLLEAPVAQAQHSVPDHAELLQALERTHAGHMVGHDQSDQPKGGYSDGYVNGFGECIKVARKVLAAAPAQAQHSVPDGYRLIRLEHFAAIKAQLDPKQVDAYRGRNIYDEDKVYANWNECRSALDEIKDVFQQIDWDAENELAELLAAAPGTEVPQAWLDVQAERRRQVEVEGYHGFRDNHYISYELSKAARAYIEVSWHALSGGLPCKKPESWPWMTGFKWSDGRTMLVKACALALAEIERLDRAAHGKEVGHE
ncbi:hypothetical protein [Pseudomonas aeruginosa]|uniref:hypothetical protein n=1 Tax=Pseudomonas aeruginosa TaxID=287 RepID=UPI0015C68B9E|nr:hypothetical protein [Pseudomonas aeruginosa]EKA7888838.1 hypothetical protein [Pseudomonas aeruginosa]EKU0811685.1 hypothetical protein [Pseudomonas aeruginosa]EMC5386726.1 hypothetical protein [Pseudomonas aeruginosa]MCS7611227.1 hypothetical protein [Pseudomonas aeruginosa]